MKGLIDSGYKLSQRIQQYYDDIIATDEEGFKASINSFISERQVLKSRKQQHN